MAFNWFDFLLGTLGGALAELLKWFQLKESTNLPAYIKSPLYWIVTALMALAGGLLAWLYGLDGAKPLLALNIGVTAPLILKGLAGAVPALSGTKGLEEPKPSVANFIAGR